MDYIKRKRLIKNILLKEDKPCLLIDGRWGIGKSYLYDDIQKELSHELEMHYVSLFGIKNIKEVENSLILRLLPNEMFKNNKMTFERKALATSAKTLLEKFTGVNFDDFLKSFTINDVSEIIENQDKIVICFDDLERVSDDLCMKEMLGFIERTTKKFKVVVIANTKEISSTNADIFSHYNEKVVDKVVVLDKVDKTIFNNIAKSYYFHNEDLVVNVYQSDNVGFGEAKHGKPYFLSEKLNNLRIYKKYCLLVSLVEKAIGEGNVLDKHILQICKEIVYKYYYAEDNKKSKGSVGDRYGIRKEIEKIFNYEDIKIENFKDFFSSQLQIRSDTSRLYNVYLLEEIEYHSIIDRIKAKVDQNELKYFDSQRNVITLVNALTEIGFMDKEVYKKLFKISQKLYTPELGNRPDKFNFEDWDSYEILGQEECNSETRGFINVLNDSNQKVYENYLENQKKMILDNRDYDRLYNYLLYVKEISDTEFQELFDYLFNQILDKYDEVVDSKINRILSWANTDVSYNFITDKINAEKNIIILNKYKKYLKEIEVIEYHNSRAEEYDEN